MTKRALFEVQALLAALAETLEHEISIMNTTRREEPNIKEDDYSLRFNRSAIKSIIIDLFALKECAGKLTKCINSIMNHPELRKYKEMTTQELNSDSGIWNYMVNGYAKDKCQDFYNKDIADASPSELINCYIWAEEELYNVEQQREQLFNDN